MQRIIALARSLAASIGVMACLGAGLPVPALAQVESSPAQPTHGLAMHGQPVLPPGFERLPYADPASRRGGRLVLGQQGTFDSLNPYIVKGIAPQYIHGLVVQSLMVRSLDEPFTLYPQIAERVEVPDDRSSITFHIDPRAAFSDGSSVTADDVVFSWALLKDKGRPFMRTPYRKAVRVETPDARTVRFDLTGAEDRELPLLLGLMPVLSKAATNPDVFDQTSFTPPLGSGPYIVTDVAPGAHFLLKRNPKFWGADVPTARGLFNFDEVRIDFYRDANGLFEAFKAGLVDLRLEGDPARWANGYDVPPVRDGRIVRESIPVGLPKSMSGFVINTRKGALADVRVREALAMLFDAEWINRNFYFDLYTRTASFFESSDLSSRGVTASEQERKWLDAFPGAVRPDILSQGWQAPVSDGSGRDRATAQKALSLLRDAGFRPTPDGLIDKNGATLSFEILVTQRPQERLSLVYAQMLKRIGIEARVRLVDDIQYWKRMQNFEFDLTPYTYSATALPGNEQFNRWGKASATRQGSLNYAGVASD
ncbi:MAG: extracellular solute-binding protein, partial [Beijerinckiaceae bacterium]